MEDLVVFKNVSKSFGKFELKDINFNIKKGHITGLIGINGAGKTTLIKMILDLLRAESGKVEAFGLDNRTHAKEVKQKIGFVFNDHLAFNEWRTEDTKKVISKFYQNWDENLYQKYATEFDIPNHKKLKTLSTGTKMKFFLAIALSHDADLLLLDEPTSGLDPSFRREFLDLILDLVHDQGKTVLFSSHITTDLDKLADYITFIHKGGVVLSDAKKVILDKYRLVKGSSSMLTPELSKVLIGLKNTSFGFEALTCDYKAIEKCSQDEVEFEIPTLEDIMVYTVRNK